jgi:hypothetical protein
MKRKAHGLTYLLLLGGLVASSCSFSLPSATLSSSTSSSLSQSVTSDSTLENSGSSSAFSTDSASTSSNVQTTSSNSSSSATSSSSSSSPRVLPRVHLPAKPLRAVPPQRAMAITASNRSRPAAAPSMSTTSMGRSTGPLKRMVGTSNRKMWLFIIKALARFPIITKPMIPAAIRIT